nr:GDSL-type esterase/lipase family protein [Lactococcus fujiensis]
MFGDSITNGYGILGRPATQILRKKLEANARKRGIELEINLQGVNGDTTTHAMKRLPQIVRKKADFVFIFFGANDASRYFSVTESEYAKNLSVMIEQLDENKVILISPPYHNDTLDINNRSNTLICRYRATMKKVGQLYDKNVIDLYGAMIASQNPNQYLQDDGLHFSARGYDLLSELMLERIMN